MCSWQGCCLCPISVFHWAHVFWLLHTEGMGSRGRNQKATSTAKVKQGRCLRLGSQRRKGTTGAGSGRGRRRPETNWKRMATEAGNGGRLACVPGRGVPFTRAGHAAKALPLKAKLGSRTCWAPGHSDAAERLSSERIFFEKGRSRSKKWPKYWDFLNQIPKVKPQNRHTGSDPRPFRSRTTGSFHQWVIYGKSAPNVIGNNTSKEQYLLCFLSSPQV